MAYKHCDPTTYVFCTVACYYNVNTWLQWHQTKTYSKVLCFWLFCLFFIIKKKLMKLDFEHSRKWKGIPSIQMFFRKKNIWKFYEIFSCDCWILVLSKAIWRITTECSSFITPFFFFSPQRNSEVIICLLLSCSLHKE